MSPNFKTAVLPLFAAAWMAAAAAAEATIHVSRDGRDGNLGTETAPVRTLYRARDLAREKAGKTPVDAVVSGGVYYLEKPLVFCAEDSGTKDAPVLSHGPRHSGIVLSPLKSTR